VVLYGYYIWKLITLTGTGKTTTEVNIITNLLTKKSKKPIMVCASSNAAVDNLLRKTILEVSGREEFCLVRIQSKAREGIISDLSHLSLHVRVRELSKTENGDHERLTCKMEFSNLSKAEEKMLKILHGHLEDTILKQADAVFCTCVTAGRFSGSRFPVVLIDEAGQAKEPETLIPLVMGSKKVILLGDQQQLGPLVVCQKAEVKQNLSTSMLQRLVEIGNEAILLDAQYRMHPFISKFPAQYFYFGRLKDGVDATSRAMSSSFRNKLKDKPFAFIRSCDLEEKCGKSYMNRGEAEHVIQIVSSLLTEGVLPEDIGIITPEAQRAFLVKTFAMRTPQWEEISWKLEISSVDSFQGREKKIIIFSTVRSSKDSDIGFLGDLRRLNVSITRAMDALVIIGNNQLLSSKSRVWEDLIRYSKELHSFLEE